MNSNQSKMLLTEEITISKAVGGRHVERSKSKVSYRMICNVAFFCKAQKKPQQLNYWNCAVAGEENRNTSQDHWDFEDLPADPSQDPFQGAGSRSNQNLLHKSPPQRIIRHFRFHPFTCVNFIIFYPFTRLQLTFLLRYLYIFVLTNKFNE